MKKIIRLAYYWLYNNLFPKYRLYSNIYLNTIRFATGNPIVYCIGDSHNMVFEYIKKQNLLPEIDLRCVTVQGATVFGLANPNSKTNALNIFFNEIKHAPKDQFISIILGEVDCGFLIWHQAKKLSTSVSCQVDASLNRYGTFLKDIYDLGFNNVIVFSIPPPTIKDGDNKGIVANQRSSISATMKERSQLTKMYNQKLKNIVHSHGFQFVDIESLLINKTTGLVKENLLNKDPTNHHLDNEKVSTIYSNSLNKTLQTHLHISKN